MKADKLTPSDEIERSIVHFEDKIVRRHWDAENEKWYFSVVDVLGAITDTTAPKRYWTDLKTKLKTEGFQLYDKIVQLKFEAKDGKKYATDCVDVETMFRVIQSTPSPKVEPIKQWLAQVAYERIEETIDPEKAINRAVDTYLRKGYSMEWAQQRLQTIGTRKELTHEWKERGIEGGGYGTLTDILTQGWSGMKTREYKDLKGLKNQNLRDHMSSLELVLNMLAEASTSEFARTMNAQGLAENSVIAARGGAIAGNARKELEEQMGKPVITSENNLKNKGQPKKLT
jgi:hypothetical protein